MSVNEAIEEIIEDIKKIEDNELRRLLLCDVILIKQAQILEIGGTDK